LVFWVGLLSFFQSQENAMENGFRPRRAAGHINIHRNRTIHAARHRVISVKHAAANRAAPASHHKLRRRCCLVSFN